MTMHSPVMRPRPQDMCVQAAPMLSSHGENVPAPPAAVGTSQGRVLRPGQMMSMVPLMAACRGSPSSGQAPAEWRGMSPLKAGHLGTAIAPSTPKAGDQQFLVRLPSGLLQGGTPVQNPAKPQISAPDQPRATLQYREGPYPSAPPLGTVPQPVPHLQQEDPAIPRGDGPHTPKLTQGGPSLEAEDSCCQEDNAARIPRMTRGGDLVSRLGDRVRCLEAELEAIRSGPLALQQDALREKILDSVKSTALEVIGSCFGQQATQLHSRMTSLHDVMISSLEKGMREAEERLQKRVSELATQPDRQLAEDGIGAVFELREMLESERQRRSDIAEKQSEVLHGIIQEFSGLKEAEGSRTQEIERLRLQLQTAREEASAAQDQQAERLRQVVEAMGEGFRVEREAREETAKELQVLVELGADQRTACADASPLLSAAMEEEVAALSQRMQQQDARCRELADAIAAEGQSAHVAHETATGAITCCQELAGKLEGEQAQRATELAKMRELLEDMTGKVYSTLRSELQEAMRQAESLRNDEQSAADVSTLRQDLAELRKSVKAMTAHQGRAAGTDASQEIAVLRAHVDESMQCLRDLVARADATEAMAGLQSQLSALAGRQEQDGIRAGASDANVAALQSQMEALTQTTIEAHARIEARQQEEQARFKELAAALREETRGAEERAGERCASASGLLQQELSVLRELVEQLPHPPLPAAGGGEGEAGTAAVPSAVVELARDLVAAEQAARAAAIADVQKEVAALQQSLQVLGQARAATEEAASGSDLEELAAALRKDIQGAEQRAEECCAATGGLLQQELSALRELVLQLPQPAAVAVAGGTEGGAGGAASDPGAEGEPAGGPAAADQAAQAAAIADVQKEVAALQQSLHDYGQQTVGEASERMEARAADVAAALQGNVEQECEKFAEVIGEIVQAAERRLEGKLEICAQAAGATAPTTPPAAASPKEEEDLEALIQPVLQKMEAQEKEHASSLQELGELFLGELAGLRASTDDQYHLLLNEISGERDARAREFVEFREALCSVAA